jgi:hypothetical protein
MTTTVLPDFSRLTGRCIHDIDPAYPALILDHETLYVCCAWRLAQEDEIIIGSFEYDDRLDRGGQIPILREHLVGRRIIEIRREPHPIDLQIRFDGGLTLLMLADSTIHPPWVLLSNGVRTIIPHRNGSSERSSTGLAA